jgi:hypothetical protein
MPKDAHPSHSKVIYFNLDSQVNIIIENMIASTDKDARIWRNEENGLSEIKKVPWRELTQRKR